MFVCTMSLLPLVGNLKVRDCDVLQLHLADIKFRKSGSRISKAKTWYNTHSMVTIQNYVLHC